MTMLEERPAVIDDEPTPVEYEPIKLTWRFTPDYSEPMLQQSILNVLIGARKYVSKKEHWGQGKLARENKVKRLTLWRKGSTVIQVCALGAMNIADGRVDWLNMYYPMIPGPNSRSLVFDTACKIFSDANSIRYNDIPEWNDDKSRTQNEVVEAFDNAIRFQKNVIANAA